MGASQLPPQAAPDGLGASPAARPGTRRAAARQLLVRGLALALRPLARSAGAAPPRRILVIKPDHLGDVLLLTPALAALRAALPGAHVSVLIGPWARRLLAGNPDIDQLLTCPFPGFVRGEERPGARAYALLARYGAWLRAGDFDAALIARDDHWWGGLLALAAGIPRRVGHAHPLVAPALTDAVAWNPRDHVTRQALDSVAALAGTRPLARAEAPGLRFTPAESERRWAAGWQAEHSPGRPLIAIQPGTGGAAKLWPAGSWAQVARALAGHGTLVLTGGPDDAAVVAEISAALDAPHHALVGAAGLGGLAALFGRCRLVLGVDSGPLHLAVSQGAPTLQIFGPGDAGRFGPWGDAARHRVLAAGLWCAPCGVLSHCPRQTNPSECMTAVCATTVIAAALELLGGAADY